MNPLSRFEQFVEQLMEGSFTRLLRSQLQPVEIAKRLTRAMEDSGVIGAGGRIIVANRYEVLLNPHDFSLFEPYHVSLERELAEYISGATKERGVVLADKPVVSISSSSSAMPKRPLVKASKSDVGSGSTHELPSDGESAALSGQTTKLDLNLKPQAGAQTRAHLRCEGAASGDWIPVNRSPYRIGRGLDNDLVLEDGRVSRHHARIEDLNKKLLLVDLRSTNGTHVNGESVTRCLLNDGDVISLGGLKLQLALEETD